jgi:hypothetical protein
MWTSFQLSLLVRLPAFLSTIVVCSTAILAETELTLNMEFVERYKNRATISTDYFVDRAHARPNPPNKDGDMHFAGRSPQIGLATVAEIQNAAEMRAAVDRVHQVEGTGQAIRVAGVWRIWPEHGGEQEHVQGERLSPFNTTNPPHVFEIHPVTQIDQLNLLASLHPIAGFETKDADTAFGVYERTRSRISVDASAVTISMPMAGYNYVEFLFRLTNVATTAADGEFAFGSILDLEGEMKVQNRRVAFIRGSAPDAQLLMMRPGNCLHLLGIPRVDLALVSWRVRNASARPEVLTWGLPYELVAVGVYGGVAEAC